MDSTQSPQDIGNVKQVEPAVGGQEKQEAVNCPRCNSTNTKFCYYNNYSLTQPRYFCKTCRRYWTAGGSLRTVPVINKRTISSSSSSFESSSKKATIPDLKYPQKISTQNPKFHQGQDLNLTTNESFDQQNKGQRELKGYWNGMFKFMVIIILISIIISCVTCKIPN